MPTSQIARGVGALASALAVAVASGVLSLATPPATALAAPPQTTLCTPEPAPTAPAPPDHPRTTKISTNPLTQQQLVTPAGSAPPPTTSARAWMVTDATTGQILGGCDTHARYAPASVIKLLTALTVAPELDPAANVTVTREDLNLDPDSSRVGLVEGGTYSVQTLLLGLLLNSGNDAANVLARAAGGDKGLPGTIEAMNALAKDLGANDTVAANAHGLDADGQLTSVNDLAIIAAAVAARPDLASYLATATTGIPAQPGVSGFQIQNDNRLLYEYEGGQGGKTGYTNQARHTYVGIAERGGRQLIVTMLFGEHHPTTLWRQGAALLDWGFALPADASVAPLHPVDDADATTQPPKVEAQAASAVGNPSRWVPALAMVGTAGAFAVIAGAAGLRRRKSGPAD